MGQLSQTWVDSALKGKRDRGQNLASLFSSSSFLLFLSLYKHKQNQIKEKERKSLELIPQNRSSSSLIFYRSPQSNLFTINKKWLVILNSKIKARKGPNQKKIDLRMFCENSLFDSLFLVNLSIFPLGFLCVLKKVLYMAIYIVKMEVGTTPKRCEIHSKSQSLM